MVRTADPVYRQIRRPDEITDRLADDLVACWTTVANTGGAVGFAFPPVAPATVAPVARRLIAGLDPRCSRLLLATVDAVLAGWLHLAANADPLVAHWGTVSRVQTHPAYRGRGIGMALMTEVRRIARDEMHLEQLHLYVRGGTGLEQLYRRLGWREVGRWPGALRISTGDDRDEIMMVLDPL